MRLPQIICLFALLQFTVWANADSQEIDSLQKVYDNAKTEKDKRQAQWLLAKAYTFVDPSKAIEISSDALAYFEKKKDLANCINALNTIGIASAIKGDYKESEEAFLKRLVFSRKLGDSTAVAGCYSSLGNVYHSTSQYKKSIKCYNGALLIFKQVGNKDGMATVYSNLGNAYKAEGDYQQALNTLFKALDLTEKLKKNTGTILSNIGNIFADMDNPSKATFYFEKAIIEFKKDKNDYYEAWCYSNIASVLFDEGKIEESEKTYLKAFVIHKEQKDQEGIAHTNHALGNIQFKRRKYDEAQDLYKKSIADYSAIGLNFEFAKVYIDWGLMELERGDTSKAVGFFNEAIKEKEFFPFDFELAELYRVMSIASKWKGDYKNALAYHEMHTVVRDSVYKMETTREFAEKEAKYQNEKKQKEIQQLKHNKKMDDLREAEAREKSKLLLNFFILGGCLLLVIVIILIRSNRMKQRNNKLLQSQNEEISHQKEIIEEKNKDITDSINYAQNIQQAILPDQATLKSVLGDAFILFMPRDIVSGDFYWIHKMENGDVYFSVADCTGHGVPGAFMSMMGNDMLNKIIIDHGMTDPGIILSELNKEVKKALAKNVSADRMRDGMDITLCHLAANRKELRYAAAMRSFYQFANGELLEWKGDKNPIGGNTETDFSFTTHTIQIKSGDALYLFTDGFADQFGGAEGKKFMSKNLKEQFKQYGNLNSEKQFQSLKERFLQWKGSFEQIDDVTVMGIRI